MLVAGVPICRTIPYTVKNSILSHGTYGWWNYAVSPADVPNGLDQGLTPGVDLLGYTALLGDHPPGWSYNNATFYGPYTTAMQHLTTATDIKFVDPDNFDYKLQVTSPGKAAGLDGQDLGANISDLQTKLGLSAGNYPTWSLSKVATGDWT